MGAAGGAAAARTAPRRLLLVAPNWLGDLVMSTVALDRLAQLRAAAGGGPDVIVAVRRRWRWLLEGDPRLAGLFTVERTGRHAGWAGLARLAREWRRERYDAAILLPPSLRAALAARLAGVPVRVGQATDRRGALLTVAVPVDPRGAVHYSEEMLAVVEAWARAAGLAAPAATAVTAARPRLPALPACAREPTDPRLAAGPPTWALATGATYGDAKSWPAAEAAGFVDRAVAQAGACLLLLGDAGARPLADAVRAASRAPWRGEPAGGAGAVDLVGRTSLPEVVGLLRGCHLFLGNDSGLMHLAAALGVATLGLFGSTDPAWTGPRGPRAEAIVASGFACAPCFRRRCPQPRFCLAALDAATVFARAAAWARPPADEGGAA